MVRWINQKKFLKYVEQHLQKFLMTEKALKDLEKFLKENGYDDELRDIYLR